MRLVPGLASCRCALAGWLRERLGVLEQVRAIGVHKSGADFPLQDAAGCTHVFRFDRALDPGYGHAFQVRRDQFDQLLFRHAQAQGVDAELVDDWTRPPAANAAPICMSCSS